MILCIRLLVVLLLFACVVPVVRGDDGEACVGASADAATSCAADAAAADDDDDDDATTTTLESNDSSATSMSTSHDDDSPPPMYARCLESALGIGSLLARGDARALLDDDERDDAADADADANADADADVDERSSSPNVLRFPATLLDGERVASLSERFADAVVLLVNVASHCGFTPQYAELQAMADEFRDQNFVVLAQPCNQFGAQEPDDAATIRRFVDEQFGVTFPLLAKADVNGDAAHPVFAAARAHGGHDGAPIEWNFHKVLLDRDHRVVAHYGARRAPTSFADDVRRELARVRDARTGRLRSPRSLDAQRAAAVRARAFGTHFSRCFDGLSLHAEFSAVLAKAVAAGSLRRLRLVKIVDPAMQLHARAERLLMPRGPHEIFVLLRAHNNVDGDGDGDDADAAADDDAVDVANESTPPIIMFASGAPYVQVVVG